MKIPARTTNRGGHVPEVQVDDCFAEDVKGHKWAFTGREKNKYLKSALKVDKGYRHVMLHRYVWELSGREPVKSIDHISGDVTDIGLRIYVQPRIP